MKTARELYPGEIINPDPPEWKKGAKPYKVFIDGVEREHVTAVSRGGYPGEQLICEEVRLRCCSHWPPRFDATGRQPLTVCEIYEYSRITVQEVCDDPSREILYRILAIA